MTFREQGPSRKTKNRCILRPNTPQGEQIICKVSESQISSWFHALGAVGALGAGQGQRKCGGVGVLNRIVVKVNPEVTLLWDSPQSELRLPLCGLPDPVHIPANSTTIRTQLLKTETWKSTRYTPLLPFTPCNPGNWRCSLHSCWSCWLSSL